MHDPDPRWSNIGAEYARHDRATDAVVPDADRPVALAARAQVALDAAGLSAEERAAAVEGIVEGYGFWLWEATGAMVWE